MARFVTGSSGSNGRVSQGPSEAGADFTVKYPALAEYMTLDILDDGSFRKRSTLQLMVEDGAWKGCLNDRHANRSCWVTAVSVEGVLAALEEVLASCAVPWRHYLPWGQTKKKKT